MARIEPLTIDASVPGGLPLLPHIAVGPVVVGWRHGSPHANFHPANRRTSSVTGPVCPFPTGAFA